MHLPQLSNKFIHLKNSVSGQPVKLRHPETENEKLLEEEEE
jgi:hypothetical protein